MKPPVSSSAWHSLNPNPRFHSYGPVSSWASQPLLTSMTHSQCISPDTSPSCGLDHTLSSVLAFVLSLLASVLFPSAWPSMPGTSWVRHWFTSAGSSLMRLRHTHHLSCVSIPPHCPLLLHPVTSASSSAICILSLTRLWGQFSRPTASPNSTGMVLSSAKHGVFLRERNCS